MRFIYKVINRVGFHGGGENAGLTVVAGLEGTEGVDPDQTKKYKVDDDLMTAAPVRCA